MLNPNETYYLKFEEPMASCLLALRTYILTINVKITTKISWGMPFFAYQNKSICYLWIDKRNKEPYIGFMDGHKIHHPKLIKGDRKRIKILPIQSDEDLPIKLISDLVNKAIALNM
jgi:hypothetical protein